MKQRKQIIVTPAMPYPDTVPDDVLVPFGREGSQFAAEIGHAYSRDHVRRLVKGGRFAPPVKTHAGARRLEFRLGDLRKRRRAAAATT